MTAGRRRPGCDEAAAGVTRLHPQSAGDRWGPLGTPGAGSTEEGPLPSRFEGADAVTSGCSFPNWPPTPAALRHPVWGFVGADEDLTPCRLKAPPGDTAPSPSGRRLASPTVPCGVRPTSRSGVLCGKLSPLFSLPSGRPGSDTASQDVTSARGPLSLRHQFA